MASTICVVQSGGSEEWKGGAKACPDRMEAKANVLSGSQVRGRYIVRTEIEC